MRLLSRSPLGTWFVQEFSSNGPHEVPYYAILSHTWSHDDSEVTFEDIKDGTRAYDDKSKPGFEKLRFCCDKAERDGLRYFWIDTCCIKKSDSVELQHALNSMFSWYQKAVRCYVLLSDVTVGTPFHGQISYTSPSSQGWMDAFRESKWFTRGWTLQELVAPRSVVFYSNDGMQLGDKHSMEGMVADVTNIPVMALQGVELSKFSVEERFSWANHRITTVPEDAAYCLLGIFDVRMLTMYADGEYSKRKKEALSHLRQAIKLADETGERIEKDSVIRIGGASWNDLDRLNVNQLLQLDTALDAYVKWLVHIFPSQNVAGDQMEKMAQTAGKKMAALLASLGVGYEDLSYLERTIKD